MSDEAHLEWELGKVRELLEIRTEERDELQAELERLRAERLAVGDSLHINVANAGDLICHVGLLQDERDDALAENERLRGEVQRAESQRNLEIQKTATMAVSVDAALAQAAALREALEDIRRCASEPIDHNYYPARFLALVDFANRALAAPIERIGRIDAAPTPRQCKRCLGDGFDSCQCWPTGGGEG